MGPPEPIKRPAMNPIIMGIHMEPEPCRTVLLEAAAMGLFSGDSWHAPAPRPWRRGFEKSP